MSGIGKKTTNVREHPRHVPVSKKNPLGITIVDQHLRRLPGTFLGPNEIKSVFKGYDLKNLIYPAKRKLTEYKNADMYDEIIAIWTDYFNKKFKTHPSLSPDVVKALIGSESGFDPDPPKNKVALGITQITKETLKILQDPKGEAKEFIFSKIRQKDLKNPAIAIPLATRWLFRKRETASSKLKREPNIDELILEYKGMLKSKTALKEAALQSFKEKYDRLRK